MGPRTRKSSARDAPVTSGEITARLKEILAYRKMANDGFDLFYNGLVKANRQDEWVIEQLLTEIQDAPVV